MVAMTLTGNCRECGTALPPGSPGGFCPRCMLGLALDVSGRMQEAAGSPAIEEEEQGELGSEKKDELGDQIAGYKLLQEIGHGGCGVVYMAEQEKPVHRRVALKVIKLGMDTKQVVARFEAERQALARMDHPNIAKVLEAGATARGRPYFAMA